MNQVQKKKRLILRELLSANEPIWVVNRSGEEGVSKTAGMVVMQVGYSDGGIGSITIPPGEDPICLSDQVDYESLKKCRDLPNLINTGFLQLLDPVQAEKYYDDNEERRRIMQEKLSKIQSQTPEEGPSPKRVNEPKIEKTAFSPSEPAPVTAKEETVCQRAMDICLKAKAKAYNEKTTLEKCIEQSRCFKECDLAYLSSQGQYKSVKSWAKEQLNKLILKQEEKE